MARELNAWILVVFITAFVEDFQVKANIAAEKITSDGSFIENTRYCDCPPLTEFDDDGNHVWQIDIIRPSSNLCGARYTCRKGYQSEVITANDTRFCFSQDAWNHTEIDCKKIVKPKESTILFIAVPSSLLAILFIVMVIFVLWWKRRVKHKTGERKLEDAERSTMEICHIKVDTNTKSIVDEQKLYGNTTIETHINGDIDNSHTKCESQFEKTAEATVYEIHVPEEADNKEVQKQIYLAGDKNIASSIDLRKTI